MSLEGFNWLDYSIVGVIGVSALISLIRGFVREALSLAGWILAFWVALTFSKDAAQYLQDYLHENTIRTVVAFVLLFLATLILTGMVNLILVTLIEKSGLSGTDRLLGMIFGLGRGVLLLALALLIMHATPIVNSPNWQQSSLVPMFNPLEQWLVSFLPKDIDFDKQYNQPLPSASAQVTQVSQES